MAAGKIQLRRIQLYQVTEAIRIIITFANKIAKNFLLVEQAATLVPLDVIRMFLCNENDMIFLVKIMIIIKEPQESFVTIQRN